MNLNIESADVILRNLIDKGKKAYHKYYEYTCVLAHDYKAYMTGDGLNEMLMRLVKRETEQDFKVRKDITEHIITSVVKVLTDVEKRVPRSNSITKILSYKSDPENKKLNQLVEILSKFWGTYSFDRYWATRELELQNTDPNSFIVIDFEPFDYKVEKPQPYPYEVSSYNAVDYLYENNVLQYLIAKDTVTYNEEIGDKYTMYFQYYWIRYTQVFDDQIINGKTDTQIIDNRLYVKINGKFYLYETGEHKLDYVPAWQPGFIRDLMTDGKTFVNNWHCAIPYLRKTLKVNSELDIVMSYMAFPRLIQYIPKCTAEGCMRGQLRNGGECPECKGTGKQRIKPTAMDAIEITLPDNIAEMASIDAFLTYKYPPTEIMKFQSDYIDKCVKMCMDVVYTPNVVTKVENIQTATETIIDESNIVNALYPMIVKLGDVWEFANNTIADLTDLNTDLIVSFLFSKDFRLLSKADTLNNLRIATDSSFPSFVKQGYMDDAARMQYQDDPEGLKKYFTKQKFFPFTGKTESEIQNILMSSLMSKYYKILYANYDNIFDLIELDMANGAIKNAEGEVVNFYDLAYTKQAEIIKKKVEEMTALIETEKPVEPVVDFTETETEENNVE